MAIITVKNRAINLDAAEIPNISADKITSGTFADARIAASNVSQHATSFDDNKIVNDISTLALRQASNENKAAYNTNSMYVDVFQDATGITNLTNATRNLSEYITSEAENFTTPTFITSDQSSVYSLSASGMQVWGNSDAATILGTGNSHGNVGDTYYFDPDNQTVSSNMVFQMDLGSGNSKIFTGARQIQESPEANTSLGCGVWKWQVSNDGSNWTDVGNNFTWGSNGSSPSVNEVTWSNNTAYRYIRVIGVSGATRNQRWQYGFQFQSKTGSISYNATGSFENNAITAPSSTNKMGAIITYQDNAGTNTLNTDIVLKLSADGGSNYATATMTAMPDFASGIKMAKVNDLSVTAGTSLKYKIEFANQASGSKEARIRGVSLQY